MPPVAGAGHDCIVVGGGTAGSIVAARLSEDPTRRVLLLEAGPDYPDELPPALRDVNVAVLAGHNWELDAVVREDARPVLSEAQKRVARVFDVASSRVGSARLAVPGAERPGARMPYPLGKVVGGGSAVNAGLALHARPEDYSRWRDEGSPEWDWERVRPYVQRVMAADAEKAALPVVTASPHELTRSQRAFREACRASGWPDVDLRDGSHAGVGAVPKCTVDGRRVSTAALYLAPARKRPNLTIMAGCVVDRLVLARGSDGWSATAVDAIVAGRRCRLSAGHVILSAGAINSPAILMRSGIGAAGDLARAGAVPVLDAPGVGRNLQDHPAVCVWAVPGEGTCAPGEPTHQVMLQQRSTGSPSLCDLQLFMVSGVPTRAVPRLYDALGVERALGVSVTVATPVSRGRVDLVDVDPLVAPRICVNCLQDAADVARMTAGVRLAYGLLTSRELAADVTRIAMWGRRAVESDALAGRLCRTAVRAAWHPVGTLRMGASTDRAAVVDSRGRLYGVRNVTVADASIMPHIPSVPTNLTCMVIGERIAGALS